MKYILTLFLLVIPFETKAQYVMNIAHNGNTIFAERTENIDSIYFTTSAENGEVETGVAYVSGDSLYKSRIIGYKGESLSISLHVGYINGGNIVEQSNYVHTSPICLRKGQTISLTGVCETAVNAISLTNQSGVTFSNLVKGKGIDQEVYEYTATEQCFVSLTYCTDFSHSIISFTETNGIISRRLKKLEDNMVVYSGSVPSYSGNPLRDLHYYPGFSSVFKSWGFIGDSMTEGVIQYKNADGEMKYDVDNYYSWGQCLCRATGADGTNFATGGITAKEWIADNTAKGWGGQKCFRYTLQEV